jgi:hypothetical protein
VTEGAVGSQKSEQDAERNRLQRVKGRPGQRNSGVCKSKERQDPGDKADA